MSQKYSGLIVIIVENKSRVTEVTSVSIDQCR